MTSLDLTTLVPNLTTAKQSISQSPPLTPKYKIWGFIPCDDQFECLEYLYYAVMSLMIVFIVNNFILKKRLRNNSVKF